MALLETAIQYGIRADQPSAASVGAGVLYCVSDEGGTIERSNGSTWDAVGGGGGLRTVVVPISAAEMLATDPLTPSTWKEIFPPLAGQQFYLVNVGIFQFTAGGSPYNESGVAVQLVSPNDGVLVLNLGTVDFTGGSVDKLGLGVLGIPGSLPFSDWVGANAQTFLFIQPQISGGDGTAIVTVNYMVGDLAP